MPFSWPNSSNLAHERVSLASLAEIEQMAVLTQASETRENYPERDRAWGILNYIGLLGIGQRI